MKAMSRRKLSETIDSIFKRKSGSAGEDVAPEVVLTPAQEAVIAQRMGELFGRR